MRIAVIGPRGLAGRFLADHLERAGHRVMEFDRGDAPPGRPLDVVVDANGDSRRFWANANPNDSFAANVVSVAERVTAFAAGCYVLLSTVDVYGAGRGARATSGEDAAVDPAGLDVYGFHKFLAEQVVTFHAACPLVLRLGTLVGPGLRKNPVFDARNGLPIRQSRDSTLSLVHLATVATALEVLLARGARGLYNIAASAPITVGRVVEMIGRPALWSPDPLTTRYDVAVDRIGALIPMPTSEAALTAYLSENDR